MVTETLDSSCTALPDNSNDLVSLVDDSSAGTAACAQDAWRILIADDDEEVHHATVFALRGVKIDGRPVTLLHARSAQEAETVLRENPGVAVALLDVVMETSDAGLKLVEVIRKELGLRNLRIVLRTGQPGYAPELDVIRAYDINDYRTKSELTQTRLITTLTSAARAYEQLEQIQASKQGMDAVAHASNALFRLHSLQELASGLFERMQGILGEFLPGLLCVEKADGEGTEDEAGLRVLYGAGQYASYQGRVLAQSANADMIRSIRRCSASRTHVFEEGRFLLCLGSQKIEVVAVFVPSKPLSALQQQLVEMFAGSMSIAFANAGLIERLDFFAHYDPLTRLPNRSRFLDEVNEDLFSRQNNNRILAVADIVRFAEINDALGYRCGDSLLTQVAKRLHTALGSGVLLARLSGDSFGIFGLADWINIDAVHHAFETPFFVHGHSLVVQLRIGVVKVGQGRGSALDLLRHANLALNQAHHCVGRACAQFTSELLEDAQQRIGMLHSLRAAIDFQRGLSLHFQPMVEIPGNTLCGVEALLRWRNDNGQMVAPSQFIPLAEQTGMMGELSRWVLDTALSRFALWQNLGYKGFYVSVNISSVEFREEHLVEKIRTALADNDVEPSQLVLELNGSVYAEDRTKVLRDLQRLRQSGIRIAMDDFGSSDFSLQRLLSLPLDIIKIDQAFVEKIESSKLSLALVRAMVDLAAESGIEVVAEGVETAEQMEALIGVCCYRMQGFHLCRPLNADQLDGWLRNRRSSSAVV